MGMVLTRKVGESVQIGPDIMVSIKSVKGKWVEVYVHAPLSYKISRSRSNAAASRMETLYEQGGNEGSKCDDNNKPIQR